MNRDIARFAAPFLALALLAFVVTQTMQALNQSGVWRMRAQKAFVPTDDPLAGLDELLAQEPVFSGASRDPFGYGARVQPPGDGRPVVRRPAVPRPPALPVLTAIIFDADPRALVIWEDRDYTIRPGGIFADFEVESISRDQVVLKRGPENIVLRRKPQGE